MLVLTVVVSVVAVVVAVIVVVAAVAVAAFLSHYCQGAITVTKSSFVRRARRISASQLHFPSSPSHTSFEVALDFCFNGLSYLGEFLLALQDDESMRRP